jgi:xanthine dehydrogenase YagT iron-sulfur-binding subunit
LDITLDINGQRHALTTEPGATLLDVLRDQLGLRGTKKGCDMGACGACTVLIDGRSAHACLALAAATEGRTVETIEGFSGGGRLHAVQSAFIDCDALQCGYCTPGQIVSAIGLLREGARISDAEIREAMSGNLCRCGAYPNIVAAIRAALSADPVSE